MLESEYFRREYNENFERFHTKSLCCDADTYFIDWGIRRAKRYNFLVYVYWFKCSQCKKVYSIDGPIYNNYPYQ